MKIESVKLKARVEGLIRPIHEVNEIHLNGHIFAMLALAIRL